MLTRARLLPAVLSLLLGLPSLGGCDLLDQFGDKGDKGDKGDDGDGGDGPKSNDAIDDAKKDAKDEADAAKNDGDEKDEDKGSATVLLGEKKEEWNAKRANARIKDDGKLRISASISRTLDDGSNSRSALTLVIKDYKGPGTYEIQDMNSHLTSVKINLKKITEAEKEGDEKKVDREATKAATDALGGASVVILRGAKVEITNATDDFIDGKLTWAGVISVRGPKKLEGEFHARIKKD